MKKLHGTYSEEFKWKVVQEVLAGKFTKEEARIAYGVRSHSGILEWMRKFSGVDRPREGGEVITTTKEMAQSKEEQALKKEIKELKEQLQREKMRAELWQKMLEVAEDQLGIDIRKKYGAKQSTNSKKSKER